MTHVGVLLLKFDLLFEGLNSTKQLEDFKDLAVLVLLMDEKDETMINNDKNNLGS